MVEKLKVDELSTMVLVPSHLLALQVHDALSNILPEDCTAELLSSKEAKVDWKNTNVLIATPRRVLQETEMANFMNLNMLVLDEADMLLSGGFEADTKRIISGLQQRARVDKKKTLQVICAGISFFIVLDCMHCLSIPFILDNTRRFRV